MTHHHPALARPPAQRGFTLVEILIALLISSVGLLGLAAMQALAMVNTQVSSVRSIVALQASSLAAAMHGNRTFWNGSTAPAVFNTVGSTVVDNSGLLTQGVQCLFQIVPSRAQCTPAQIAAYDVQNWASNLNALLPSYSAAVACSTAKNAPYSCVITVVWTERYVSMGRNAQADSAATGGSRSFSLYVEP